jgi:serine phosphatase RsbU (regulator of sigma subunit)
VNLPGFQIESAYLPARQVGGDFFRVLPEGAGGVLIVVGDVSGFVTCSVALIAIDGSMMLANAGNPAPYRNGEEMAVEPGLPLGMIAEVSYAETRCQIAAGDRLTFVSDGVVEATNPQGELYGFERTQAVSSKPANAIAEAAAQFGQEDDITVLTFTRLSVERSG